jgi:DNA-binding response OmpR family regulator
MSNRILYLEDNSAIAGIVDKLLIDFDVVLVETLALAKEKLKKETFDAILTDLTLEDSEGTNTVLALKEYNLPIIVLTGNPSKELLDQVVSIGVEEYVFKVNLSKSNLPSRIYVACEKGRKLKRKKWARFDEVKPFLSYAKAC